MAIPLVPHFSNFRKLVKLARVKNNFLIKRKTSVKLSEAQDRLNFAGVLGNKISLDGYQLYKYEIRMTG